MEAESSIPCGLVLVVRDVDPDYLLVAVRAGDGDFAGTAEVYENLDLARTLAADLKGFPRSPADEREVVLGSFDAKHAGGALRLRLFCVDLAGHARANLHLVDQPLTGEPPRTVEFLIPIEARALDAFVAALGQWGPRVGDAAVCVGAA